MIWAKVNGDSTVGIYSPGNGYEYDYNNHNYYLEQCLFIIRALPHHKT